MKLILSSSIAALALLFATGAQAASGIATANVNLRTGPGTQYSSLGSIPSKGAINVVGCTNGYGWCRVNYRGLDGWTSSRYIAVKMRRGGYTSNDNFGSNAAAIGIPLIAGIVIGSTSNNNNRWNDRPHFGHRPTTPAFGPGPYRPGPGWSGPNLWGAPRPHWLDRPGWRDHPGYHPNFYGPGDRWHHN